MDFITQGNRKQRVVSCHRRVEAGLVEIWGLNALLSNKTQYFLSKTANRKLLSIWRGLVRNSGLTALAIDKNAWHLVENGNSKDIANIAWACATMEVDCRLLFKAIDSNALYVVDKGHCQYGVGMFETWDRMPFFLLVN